VFLLLLLLLWLLVVFVVVCVVFGAAVVVVVVAAAVVVVVVVGFGGDETICHAVKSGQALIALQPHIEVGGDTSKGANRNEET
jgi:hypothetical protein